MKDLYEQAKQYSNNYEYKKALKILKKIKEKNASLYYEIALCYYNLFKEKKALKYILLGQKLELTNKQTNEFTALLEAVNSKLNKIDKKDSFYTSEQLEKLDEHITKFYGKYDKVYHDTYNTNMHVDIAVINPTKEKNYYTLITMGMGAYDMKTPDELQNFKNAELLIYLPSYWQIESKEEHWFWPIKWLKILSTLPMENNTWLGGYHTIPNGQPFALNTKLSGLILIDPQDVEKESFECKIDNKTVNFYQLFPLYDDEMNYKLEYGAEALFSLIPTIDPVINTVRETVFEMYESNIIDSSYYHAQSIKDKSLNIDEINASNHITIFLKWCLDNKLIVENLYNSIKDYDLIKLRDYLNNNLNGDLNNMYLTNIGIDFANYYYKFNTENKYPSDIDSNALNYFGPEKYNSEEFLDEAYLFVPFDIDYYNNMKKKIDENFKIYKKNIR